MGFLIGIGQKFFGWIMLGVAAVAALAAMFGLVRKGGRDAEKVDGLERTVENARERREIDRDTGNLDDDDLDSKLRDPSRR